MDRSEPIRRPLTPELPETISSSEVTSTTTDTDRVKNRTPSTSEFVLYADDYLWIVVDSTEDDNLITEELNSLTENFATVTEEPNSLTEAVSSTALTEPFVRTSPRNSPIRPFRPITPFRNDSPYPNISSPGLITPERRPSPLPVPGPPGPLFGRSASPTSFVRPPIRIPRVDEETYTPQIYTPTEILTIYGNPSRTTTFRDEDPDNTWYYERQAGWNILGSDRRKLYENEAGIWWTYRVARSHIDTGDIRFYDRVEFIPRDAILPH